jgi:RNA polymerase-binding transcription factor DksA
MDTYQEARQNLLTLQMELTDRLKDIERRVGLPLPKNLEDQAIASESEEVLAKLHEQVLQELRDVENALHRIERNEYETCAGCKRPIPTERLQALPFTQLCIECAQKKQPVRAGAR